jgi:hypothetical protein
VSGANTGKPLLVSPALADVMLRNAGRQARLLGQMHGLGGEGQGEGSEAKEYGKGKGRGASPRRHTQA